jgi:uncharacterized ParB-like nuclease family protein
METILELDLSHLHMDDDNNKDANSTKDMTAKDGSTVGTSLDDSWESASVDSLEEIHLLEVEDEEEDDYYYYDGDAKCYDDYAHENNNTCISRAMSGFTGMFAALMGLEESSSSTSCSLAINLAEVS